MDDLLELQPHWLGASVLIKIVSRGFTDTQSQENTLVTGRNLQQVQPQMGEPSCWWSAGWRLAVMALRWAFTLWLAASLSCAQAETQTGEAWYCAGYVLHLGHREHRTGLFLQTDWDVYMFPFLILYYQITAYMAKKDFHCGIGRIFLLCITMRKATCHCGILVTWMMRS